MAKNNNNNQIPSLDMSLLNKQSSSGSGLDDIFTSNTSSQTSKKDKKNNNKNNAFGILGRGLGIGAASIGSGATKAIDSIADSPFTIGNALAQGLNKLEGSAASGYNANVMNQLFNEVKDTHVLGKGVKSYEDWVDERQQAIMTDNPDSKLAEITYKGTELAESAGRMLPTIAVSAGVGAAMGGANVVTEAAKSTIAKVSENAGLAAMWAGVYDSTIDEAMAEGKDFEYASRKALADATLEVVTEKMWGGIAGLAGKGEGWIPSVTNKIYDTPAFKEMSAKFGTTKVGTALANTIAFAKKISDTPMGKHLFSELTIGDAVGEAIEEMVSEWRGPAWERFFTGDESIENASFGQVLEAGFGGALMSVFMSPLSKVQTSIQENQMAKTVANWSELSMVNKANIMTRYMKEGWSGLDAEAEGLNKTYGTFLQLEDIKKMSAFDLAVQNYVQPIEITAETTAEEFAAFEERFKEGLKMQSQINTERVLAKQYVSSFGTLESRVQADPMYQQALATLQQAQQEYDAQKAAAAQVTEETAKKGKKGKSKKNAKLDTAYKQLQQIKDAFNTVRQEALVRAEQTVADEYAAGTLDEAERNEYEAYLKWSEQAPASEMGMTEGYFVQQNEAGEPTLMNKEMLAQQMYNNNAPSLTDMRANPDMVDLVNEVEEEFASRSGVRDARDETANKALADEINAANQAKGINSYTVEVRDLGAENGPAVHGDGTIVLNSRYVQNPVDADFYLGHESIHNIFDTFKKNGDTNGLKEFTDTLKSVMALSGNDYAAWLDATYKNYGNKYLKQELNKYCVTDPSTMKLVPSQKYSKVDMATIYQVAKANAKARFEGGTYQSIDENGKITKTEIEGAGEEETFAKFVSFLYSSTGFVNNVTSATPELVSLLQGATANSSLKDVSNAYLANRVNYLNEVMNKCLQDKIDNEKSLLDEVPSKDPQAEASDILKADWLLNQPDPRDPDFYHFDPSLLPAESVNWTSEDFGDYWEEMLPHVTHDSMGNPLPQKVAELASRAHPMLRNADNELKVLYHGTPNDPFDEIDINASGKKLDKGFYLSDQQWYALRYIGGDSVSEDKAIEYTPSRSDGGFEQNPDDVRRIAEQEAEFLGMEPEDISDIPYGGYYVLYSFATNPIVIDARNQDFQRVPMTAVMDEFTSGGVKRPKMSKELEHLNDASVIDKSKWSDALAKEYPSYKASEFIHALTSSDSANVETQADVFSSDIKPGDWRDAFLVRNVGELSPEEQNRIKRLAQSTFGIRDVVFSGRDALLLGHPLAVEDLVGLEFSSEEERAEWKKFTDTYYIDSLIPTEGAVEDYWREFRKEKPEYSRGSQNIEALLRAARLANRDGLIIFDIIDSPMSRIVHNEYVFDYNGVKSIYNDNPNFSTNELMGDASDVFFENAFDEDSEGYIYSGRLSNWDELYNDGDALFDAQIEELQRKYGTFEGTDIPRKLDADTAISKFTANVATSKDLPSSLEPAIKNLVVDACTNTAYSISRDKDALDGAYKWFKKFETTNAQGDIATDLAGAAREYITLSEGGKVTDKRTIVKGQLVIRAIMEKVAQEGNMASDDDANLFSQMVAAVAHDETRAGQVVQAATLLKKMTPSGRMYFIERAISDIQEELDKQRDSIFSSAKSASKNLKELSSNEEYKQALAEMARATTQQELDDAEQHLVEIVAKQIPPDLTTRLVAWRYLSMLGNLRTHERNIISNAASYIASGLTTKMSGALQDVFVKNGEKTATTRKVSQATKDFVKNDWNVYGSTIYKSGGKMASFATKVEQARRNFGNNAAGNLLEAAYKFNNEGIGTDNLLGGLEGEDTYFGKLNYKMAMEQYITANDIDVSIFTNPATKNTKQTLELLDKIRGYAMQQANRATYHEANLLANKLNELERSSPLGKLLVGGIAPFKRTPVNILKQGVKYSPVGIINGVKELAVDVKNGDMSVGEAINDLCQGMTGSMIMLLGYFLAGAGLLKAGGADSDREEYYDEMLGRQKYSITIGDTNYTLDWLTPVSMPLFAGATIVDALAATEDESNDTFTFEDILGVVGSTFDPLTNLSLLSGINDALSAYGSDNKLAQLGLSAAESYLTQFIPTVAGQVARAVDPVRRTTYASKESDNPFGSRGEKFLRRIAAKIPFLSQNDEPYVDMWGNEDVREGGLGKRLIDQMLVPWYSAKIESTAVDDRLAEVFAEAGTPTVLPATPNAYFTIGGKTKYLSAEEYTAIKKIVGRLSYQGIDTATQYSVFNQQDGDTKADIVSDIYSFTRTYAKYQWLLGQGYTDEQISKILSAGDYGKVTRAKRAIDSGLNLGQYYTIKKLVGQKSKKKEKINLMSDYGLTDAQMEVFLD